MKRVRFNILALLFAICAAALSAQTLYVPGGAVGNISGNNVGIGTTGPTSIAGVSEFLDISGTTTGIVLHSTSASKTWEMFNDGPGLLRFYSSGHGDTMTLDQSGNVGIGTTSPDYLLDVNGPIRNRTGADPSPYTKARLFVYGGTNVDTANWGYFGYGADAVMRFVYAKTGSTAGQLAFGTTDATNNTGTFTEKMRMDNAGNVGIGTPTPLSKLHVMGVGRFGLNDAGNNNIGGILVASGTGVGGARQYWIGASNPTSHNNNMFEISDYDGTTNSPLITIFGTHAGSAAGNVGIGTTNPTQKLSVNGTIQAKEVVVQTGWSDYVFDESYKLKALSDVEAYVKTEHHLPGIPSAKEVAEHGVSMGEMQSKLLAKIEELTLHVIAQEKHAVAQQNEIAVLRNQVKALSRQ